MQMVHTPRGGLPRREISVPGSIGSTSSILLNRYLSPVPWMALVSTMSMSGWTSRMLCLKTSFSAWEMRSVLVTMHMSERSIIGAIFRGAWVPERDDITQTPNEFVKYGVHLRHSPALSTISTSAPLERAHCMASVMIMMLMWSGHMSPE